MKLRIHHQEIRFRLSPRDLAKLATHDTLEDQLSLTPGQSWSYALRLDAASGHGELATSDEGRKLSVHLPLTRFRQWLLSGEIEWSLQQPAPKLSILIEKDLKPHRSERRGFQNEET